MFFKGFLSVFVYMLCVVFYVAVVKGCVSLRLLCRCVVYIYVVAYVVGGGFCCVSCFSLCLLFRCVTIYLQTPPTPQQQHEATKRKFLRVVVGGV